MPYGIARRLLPLTFGLLSVITPMAAAQDAGRLTGRIVNAEGGSPIGGATVRVVDSDLQVRTAVDGRYTFLNVPVGTARLRVVMLGFSPKTVTDISIVADSMVRQDVSLNTAAVELGEIIVKAEVERGSVNAAIDIQRNAAGIVSATSAEQIARSPDGDAGAALQRVSGASMRDGKPSVRGLGEKSTTGTLNGARMISSEPESKTLDLGLVPSSLLETITVSKTASADQEGDFAGATIRIQTKEAIERAFTSFSISSGFNSAVTGQPVLSSPSIGRDIVAAGAGGRALPSNVAAADLMSVMPSAQVNSLVNSFRNVWSAKRRQGAPNASVSFNAGGTIPPVPGGINYLLSGSWSRTEEIRADQVRALAVPTGSGIAEEDRFVGSTGRQSVLWGGIANFNLNIGSNTKVGFHNTYTRSMDNEGREEHGRSENLGGLLLDVTRLRYVERSVLSDRLSLHRQFGQRHALDASVTYGGVRRQEPDRSEMVYVHPSTSPGTAEWLGFSNEAAVRTFGDLREHALEGSADWQMRLADVGGIGSLKMGALYRSTRRDADNRAYSIALSRPLPEDAMARTPEAIFNGDFTGESDTYFRIVPFFAGGSYTADDRLIAGYVQTTLPLGSAIELTTGFRVEDSHVRVTSLSTASEPSLADLTFTDLLPSLALTWHERPTTNFRFSVSRTLARPEYRELSPILVREVIGGDNVRGDINLRRSLIENYDLRWEYYPKPGELLSVALFAKQFHDPLERVYQATSGTRIITMVNALGATDVGVEFEARRQLSHGDGVLSHFALGANVTAMHSAVTIDRALTSVTSDHRRMVGQAPYLINASLTWTSTAGQSSATILFNRIGDRITEAGESPLPDVVEQPRSLLDASVRFPLMTRLGVKINAQNLLDAPIRVTQGPVVREYSRAGRVMSIGFSWTQ